MGDDESKHCSCINPNGFKFLEYKLDHQVWIHIKCGGQVVRTLIKSERWIHMKGGGQAEGWIHMKG
jgi:hypothetical protein